MGYCYHLVNHTKKEICGYFKKLHYDIEEFPDDPVYFEDQWEILRYLRDNTGDMIQFMGEDSGFIEARLHSYGDNLSDYKIIQYPHYWPKTNTD